MVGGINHLPEDCISHVISFTTPRDACVSSTVSGAFRSAADSDATWNRFLPSDYATILSQADEPVEYASKKELYMQLSDHPVLINGGLMSFELDKLSGAKCFMISAKAMSIMNNDSRYWTWVTLRESRFNKCAGLNYVWWLEMRGKIDSRILTPHTTYAAYLIFKRTNGCRGFVNPLQTTAITISGDVVSQHSVCLHPDERQQSGRANRRQTRSDVKLPTERRDGWMEIEMGEFYSGDVFDGEVDMSLKQVNCNYIKQGILVQGIQVRPKH